MRLPPRSTCALALALGGAACSQEEPAPNVLVVTLDTTRWDRLDLGGRTGNATPTVAALAAHGTELSHARTPVPITLPAHLSLFTGMDPDEHGVRNNGRYLAPPSLELLPEVLKTHGWSTGAAIAAMPVSRQFGTDQGFDHFDQEGLARGVESFAERRADAVTDAALALVAQLEEPWFLWVHYFDPHHPFEAPEGWAGEHRDAYQDEIVYMDHHLGRLLAGLPEGPRYTVLTADHGESLGEHGELTHGMFLHDATLRVPLVFSGPGVVGGQRVATPASLVDVAPTLAELLEVPAPAGATGRSLAAALRGENVSNAPLYAESLMPLEALGLSPVASVLDGELRLVRTHRDRLFDLGADPGETRDVAAERPDEVARLGAILDGRAPATTVDQVAPDAETTAHLEALGYVVPTGEVASGQPVLEDTYDRPDMLQQASPDRFLTAEDLGDPEALLEKLRASGGSAALWTEALAQLDRVADAPARTLVVEALATFPAEAEVLSWVALHGARLQLPDEASAALDVIVAQVFDPAHATRRVEDSVLLNATEAAGMLGRTEQAARLLEEARQRDIRLAPLRLARARLLHRAGDPAAAEADYTAALALQPDDGGAWRDLAFCRAEQGNWHGAGEALDRALQRIDDNPDLWLRRAAIADRAGDAAARDAACGRHRELGGTAAACGG